MKKTLAVLLLAVPLLAACGEVTKPETAEEKEAKAICVSTVIPTDKHCHTIAEAKEQAAEAKGQGEAALGLERGPSRQEEAEAYATAVEEGEVER